MKKIFLIVLGVVLLFFIYRITAQKPLTVNSEKSENTSSKWVTTDFGGAYGVNISYPKGWILNCCGDTDGGTVNELYSKMVDNRPSEYIQLYETYGYSNDIEGPRTNPQAYYKNDIASGKLKKIDNITTTNLGTSVLGLSAEKTEYSVAGHTSFKEYIFQIPDKDAKPLYYAATFYTPSEFPEEFIQEFLNRLTLTR